MLLQKRLVYRLVLLCAVVLFAGFLGCSDSAPQKITAASSGYEVAADEEDEDLSGRPKVDSERIRSSDAVTAGGPPSSSEVGDDIPLDPFTRQAKGQTDVTGTSRSDAVANGTLDELLEKLDQVVRSGIRGDTEEEQLADLNRLMAMRITIAEKILEQGASPEYRVPATFAKLDSLSVLTFYEQPGALQRLCDYTETLKDDAIEDIRVAASKAKLEALEKLAGTNDPDAVQRLQEAFQLLLNSETPSIRMEAIKVKISHLTRQIELGDPDARQQYEQFASSLIEEKDPDATRLGKMALISLKAGRIASGESQELETLLTDLQELFQSEGKTKQTFEASGEIIRSLSRQGCVTEALDVGEMVAEQFASVEDAELKAAAVRVVLQAKLMAFQENVRAVLNGNGERRDGLIEITKMLLENRDLGVSEFQLMMPAMLNLEAVGEFETARQMLMLVRDAYQDHSNPQLVETTENMVQAYELRIGMLGQPMELEGVTVDGETFDWSSYQGKVVLVDFWATWCGPCLEEIPNIKLAYEQYREHGFEVVGVNMDDESIGSKLPSFLKRHQIPWRNVLGKHPGTNPNAVRYGVESLPFLVLVDRDGTVAAIHLRGPEIHTKVKELLALARDPLNGEPPSQPPVDAAAQSNPVGTRASDSE